MSCVILSGCSISPQNFEVFCRANYHIQLNDQTAWRSYVSLLAMQARKAKTPMQLEDIADFRIEGEASPQGSPALFMKPAEQFIVIYKGKNTVAVINDFWSSYVSGENGRMANCSSRVPELWSRVK